MEALGYGGPSMKGLRFLVTPTGLVAKGDAVCQYIASIGHVVSVYDVVGIELVRLSRHPAHDALVTVPSEDPLSELVAMMVLG